MLATEHAILIRGGHPIRHPSSSLVVGETEKNDLWLVRAIDWAPGEMPMLYLVGPEEEHTWVPYEDVMIGGHMPQFPGSGGRKRKLASRGHE